MNLEEIIEAVRMKTGFRPKRSGQKYQAHCPAHDDQNPSLSISSGENGKILFNCFSGCTVERIVDALGIKISDLFPSSSSYDKTSTRIEYVYSDEEGKELYKKVRIEPGFDGRPKSFYWERNDQQGQVIKNLTGCRKVLYRLPELRNAIQKERTIFLVEGEKDVDKLIGYGLAATTAPESMKWQDEFTDTLKDADVALLFDMDQTGYKRRDTLTECLYGCVKRLRVVCLPGLVYQDAHGVDISDWLAGGRTVGQLVEIVNTTPDYTPPLPDKKEIKVVNFQELMNLDIPKRQAILSPFLLTQSLCMLYAMRGVGKTHVALGIAYAIATGGSFLKWNAPTPKRVLYVDGEMPVFEMQDRLRRINLGAEQELLNSDYFRLVTPDLQGAAMPDLATRAGRAVLDALIDECDLIIISTLHNFVIDSLRSSLTALREVKN